MELCVFHNSLICQSGGVSYYSAYGKSLSHILHITAYCTYHACICIPMILFTYFTYSAYHTYFIHPAYCSFLSQQVMNYLTTRVTFHYEGDKGDISPKGCMQLCLCFQTKLHVFCTNTMIHHMHLWACLPSLWTGVTLAFTASSNRNG
jgi:hypothetical protein